MAEWYHPTEVNAMVGQPGPQTAQLGQGPSIGSAPPAGAIGVSSVTTAPASAPPLNPVNPQGLEGQVRELSAQLRALGERFEKLERIREQLAEFNFQAITVILAVLTLAIAAPIAVLHGVNPTADQLVEILDAILAADTAIALCWLVLWMRLYLKPVKS